MLFNLKSLGNVIPAVKDAFTRFPLSSICTLGAIFASLLLIHEVDFADKEFIGKCLASFSLGLVAFTSLKLLVESHSWSIKQHIISAAAVAAIIIVYVWSIYIDPSPESYALLSLAVCLSLLFSPYINIPSDSNSVWYFNYQTGVAIFFAGLSAIVLGAGLSLILTSVGYLFEINIPSKAYGDVWLLSWGVMFSIYVLSNISKLFNYESEPCDFPKGVSFIANYVLTPLMWAYMIILYVYFIKIIFQWELPRGNLGWMITAFGSIGIVTKLVAYPIRNQGTRLLILFDRYYYYALIVPVILLFIAIGARIHQYGITEQRYYVILLGVWFALVVVASVIKRDQFNIKYVPMVLAGLALLASFGPWGASCVSVRSQISRFETLLEKNKLLVDGRAIRAGNAISFNDRKALSSIADYLSDSEYKRKYIKPLFKSLITSSGNKDIKTGRGFIELLGITYVNRWETKHSDNRFEYRKYPTYKNVLVNTSGYDYVGHSRLYFSGDNCSADMFNVYDRGLVDEYKVIYKDGYLSVTSQSNDVAIFDITGLIVKLKKQNISQEELYKSGLMSLTSKSRDGGYEARLQIDDIGGTIAGDVVKFNYIEYVVMLKKLNN